MLRSVCGVCLRARGVVTLCKRMVLVYVGGGGCAGVRMELVCLCVSVVSAVCLCVVCCVSRRVSAWCSQQERISHVEQTR